MLLFLNWQFFFNEEEAMKAKSFPYIYTHAIEGEKEKAATDKKAK